MQDTRTTTSYFSETADGAATVRGAALVRRPPRRDRYSYLAFTALATASTRPGCLKAIATSVYSADRVSSWYPGGTFDLQLAMIWATLPETGNQEAAEDPFMPPSGRGMRMLPRPVVRLTSSRNDLPTAATIRTGSRLT
jgi:hypothetical protein